LADGYSLSATGNPDNPDKRLPRSGSWPFDGAIAAGLGAVWVNRAGRPRPEDRLELLEVLMQHLGGAAAPTPSRSVTGAAAPPAPAAPRHRIQSAKCMTIGIERSSCGTGRRHDLHEYCARAVALSRLWRRPLALR
jgi:hypothetical protein